MIFFDDAKLELYATMLIDGRMNRTWTIT